MDAVERWRAASSARQDTVSTAHNIVTSLPVAFTPGPHES